MLLAVVCTQGAARESPQQRQVLAEQEQQVASLQEDLRCMEHEVSLGWVGLAGTPWCSLQSVRHCLWWCPPTCVHV